MVRRLLHVVALAAVLLVASPGLASAFTVTLVAPEDGRVTGRTEVTVEVQRDATDGPVGQVRVRLPDGDPHVVDCTAACDSRSPRFSFDLDPLSGAPLAPSPLPNGDLTVQLEGLERGLLEERWVTFDPQTLRLAVHSLGVRELTPTVEDDQRVRLDWRAAPEPDVTRYVVVRDGNTEVAELRPDQTSFTESPGPGAHTYQVRTYRPSGSDGSLETTSADVRVTVEPPPSDPPTDVDPGVPDRPGTQEPPPSGEQEAGAPDRPQDDPSDGATPRDGSAGGTPRATPPTLDGRGDPIPDVPEADDGFDEALDYDVDGSRDQAPRSGSSDGRTGVVDDEVVLATGDRDGSVLGTLRDPDRVAVPIAGGLLLTAIALHLWRWVKVPATD